MWKHPSGWNFTSPNAVRESPHQQVCSVKLLGEAVGKCRQSLCCWAGRSTLPFSPLIHEQMSGFDLLLEAWVNRWRVLHLTSGWRPHTGFKKHTHTDKSFHEVFMFDCAAPISWSQTTRLNRRSVSRWSAPHWAAACLHVRLPVVQHFSNWFEAAGGPLKGDSVH